MKKPVVTEISSSGKNKYRLEHGYNGEVDWEDSEEFEAESDAVAIRRAKKLNQRLLREPSNRYYVRLHRIVVVEQTERVWSNHEHS